VGPSVTAVAGSVAGRSCPASAAMASGRDPPTPLPVRPLPCSRVARPDRPTVRGETVDRSADHADHADHGRSRRDPFRPSAARSPRHPPAPRDSGCRRRQHICRATTPRSPSRHPAMSGPSRPRGGEGRRS
jgi:hypothetical protein